MVATKHPEALLDVVSNAKKKKRQNEAREGRK
jgi:hypothetical protein